MYIYIAAAVVVLLLLVVAYYFMKGDSSAGSGSSAPRATKWAALKTRNAGESDDAWSRRIFGALRMNPAQGNEQSQINLNYLLAGKNAITKADATEFVNSVNHWYPAQLEQSGYAKGGVVFDF